MSNSHISQVQVTNALAATRHGLAALSKQVHLISEQFRKSFVELQQAIPNYDSFFAENLKSLRDFREGMQRINSTITDEHTHKVLMEHGWVFPSVIPVADIEHIVNLFSSNPDEADQVLCNILDDNAEHIKDSLIQSFPSRETVLRDAFEAHDNGKFTLSIPVFLAQADGMWKERSGNNFFYREIDTTITRLAGELHNDSITRALLLALSQQEMPLFLTEKDRPSDFSALNRHQVLHGESLDYGTRKNSLQAMAFLDYCGMILPDLPEE